MTTRCVVRAALTEERSKGASKAALRRSDETKSFYQRANCHRRRLLCNLFFFINSYRS